MPIIMPIMWSAFISQGDVHLGKFCSGCNYFLTLSQVFEYIRSKISQYARKQVQCAKWQISLASLNIPYILFRLVTNSALMSYNQFVTDLFPTYKKVEKLKILLNLGAGKQHWKIRTVKTCKNIILLWVQNVSCSCQR